jgi:hypothetical protein
MAILNELKNLVFNQPRFNVSGLTMRRRWNIESLRRRKIRPKIGS